jgi:hypothetical protein
MRGVFFGAIMFVLLGVSASAQTQQSAPNQQSAIDPNGADQQVFIPPPAPPAPAQPTPAQKPDSSNLNQPLSGAAPNAAASGPSVGTNDRLFFALPNFGTVENAENVRPLTTKQKFDLQWRGTFDPVEFPYVGLIAGISQAENNDPGYGQGALGYAKRYGAGFLDSIDENFMVGAIYPTILKQDPRYYQLGKGGAVHRALYSVSRIFVTRSDSGKTQFNFSEILGSATAAGIGTSYRVGQEQSLSDAATDWGSQVGWDTVSNLLKEFWPDIRRQFHHNG